GARAGFMNGFRNQLFSGAAFAGDQNRRSGCRNLFDDPKDLLHDLRTADDGASIDLATHRLSQRTALFFFSPSLNSGGDGYADVFVLKRFANAPKRTFF